MDQTERGGWEHQEQNQNIDTEIFSNLDLFRGQILKQKLSQHSKSVSKNSSKVSKMQGKHSLPLLLIQEMPSLSFDQTQKPTYLSNSQRDRFQVQEKARKLLIEQSESQHKLNLTHHYFLRKQNTQIDDNTIEGFGVEGSHFERVKKKVKQQMKSFHHNNTKSNQQKQLQLVRSKRRSLLLHTQHSEKQKQKQATIQKSVEKKTQSNQSIKKVLCKISNLKNINASFDTQDNLNKNFLLLQQKIYKKRLSLINYTHKRKKNTSVDHYSPSNQNSLAIYTRKLIYSEKGKDDQNETSQCFQRFRMEQKMLLSHSQIFQPINRNIQNKKLASYRLKSKSVDQKPQKLSKYHQAMINIFNQLKQTKRKQNIVKGTVNYQKLKKKNQTIHNIHNITNRQQAVMKFHWQKQRTKLRNVCTKSETVDMFKLSLMAEQNRKTMTVIDNAINRDEIKIQNKRMKTEFSQNRSNRFQIISPIFLTQK